MSTEPRAGPAAPFVPNKESGMTKSLSGACRSSDFMTERPVGEAVDTEFGTGDQVSTTLPAAFVTENSVGDWKKHHSVTESEECVI